MARHNVSECGEGCWPRFDAVQRLKGQLPPTYHEHRCDVHDVRLGAFCKACELPLEPPRSQRLPARGHGLVGCAGCQSIVLICPLGEAEADDHLEERMRHPAAVG